jgi:ATP-dependent DNA ligase
MTASLADLIPGAEWYEGPTHRVKRGADRPAFRDAWTIEAALASGDVCEIKEDGRWAHVHVRDGRAVLVSREGREMATVPAPAGVRCVLAAEYLVGQPTCRKGSPRHGAIVVFDCLSVGNADLRLLPQRERRAAAAEVVQTIGGRFELVRQRPTAGIVPAALLDALRGEDAEGIVVKDSAAPYGSATWVRWKRRA